MPCNQNICIKIFFASTDPKGLCLHEREMTTGRFLVLFFNFSKLENYVISNNFYTK